MYNSYIKKIQRVNMITDSWFEDVRGENESTTSNLSFDDLYEIKTRRSLQCQLARLLLRSVTNSPRYVTRNRYNN